MQWNVYRWSTHKKHWTNKRDKQMNKNLHLHQIEIIWNICLLERISPYHAPFISTDSNVHTNARIQS